MTICRHGHGTDFRALIICLNEEVQSCKGLYELGAPEFTGCFTTSHLFNLQSDILASMDIQRQAGDTGHRFVMRTGITRAHVEAIRYNNNKTPTVRRCTDMRFCHDSPGSTQTEIHGGTGHVRFSEVDVGIPERIHIAFGPAVAMVHLTSSDTLIDTSTSAGERCLHSDHLLRLRSCPSDDSTFPKSGETALTTVPVPVNRRGPER